MNLYARLLTGVFTIAAIFQIFGHQPWWLVLAYFFAAICSLTVALRKYYLPIYILGVLAYFVGTLFVVPGISELRYLDSDTEVFKLRILDRIYASAGLFFCFLILTFYMFKANHRRMQWKGFKKYYY